MEHVISGLLQDFEAGKLTRRQLIQALALGVTVGPAALAAAQKPAEKSSIPPPHSMAAWKTVWLDHVSYVVSDYRRSTAFYRDLMGFKVIEEFRHEGISLYARLRAPGGDGTIAIHLAGPGVSLASDGVRLYFEVRDLDDFCRRLQAKGFYITQLPRMMPWGWRHAYLNDPDGHEISLYWAGEKRMQKTVMQAARQVEKTPPARTR